MGDVEKAKRELRFAAGESRWDALENRIKTIEAALEGVSDADKAPVLAELAPLREKLQKGLQEENGGRIEREIRRMLNAAFHQFDSSAHRRWVMSRCADWQRHRGRKWWFDWWRCWFLR